MTSAITTAGIDVDQPPAGRPTTAAVRANTTAIRDQFTTAASEISAIQVITGALSTTYQPLDSDLTAIAALTSAADKVPYSTGAATWALADFTAAGRAIVDDADATAQRATLGLVIGTNVQAYDGDLAAIAGLTSAADKLPYFTGSGTAAVADFTANGRAILTSKVVLTAPATSATLTLADGSTLALAGAFVTTLTATGTTGVTLPTTGTLATLAGTETLTNKSLTAPNMTGALRHRRDSDEHSLVDERLFEPTNAAYTTVLTITPAATTSVYCRGYVEFDFTGDTGGVGNGVTRSLWYFDISNGAPTVANFGADVTSGTGAAAARLNMSGNAIQVQIQSSNGTGSLGGTLRVVTRVPKPSGVATTFTLA